MVDVDRNEAQIREALRKLARSQLGVQGPNLKDSLDDVLIDLWHLRSERNPKRIREVVTWQLKQLIDDLLREPKHKKVARFSFNITGDGTVAEISELGNRQKRLASDEEPMSYSAVQACFRDNVVAEFASSLHSDPPPPMPEAEPRRSVTDSAEKVTDPNGLQPAPPAEPLVAEQSGAPTDRRKTRLLIGVVSAVGLLVIGAVVLLILLNQDDELPSNASDQEGGNQSSTPASPLGNDRPQLTFDDLGGGDPTVFVYEGYTETAKEKAGRYNDGDSLPAICKVQGRMVSSHPEDGEKDVESDDWIQVDTGSGKKEYASAVYVENRDELLAKLDVC